MGDDKGLTALVQTFRLDEAISRPDGGVRTHSGNGLNDQEGGNLRVSLFPIDTGIPGLNVRFGRDEIGAGFFSPRHRHNFDQFRYVISGSISIAKNVDLEVGECGYFPEGTFYGPQDQKGSEGIQLVLQFPGPNAAYYMLQPEKRSTVKALIAAGGVFEDGAYKVKTSDGRQVNRDGWEAMWETHVGHPVEYAQPRYQDPIIMKSSSYRWTSDSGRSGIQWKHLGTFNEYRTSVALMKLAPGTVISSETLASPELRYVLNGDTIYDGKELGVDSCYYIPDGVPTKHLESRSGAELLVISIPMYVRATWQLVRDQMMARHTDHA